MIGRALGLAFGSGGARVEACVGPAPTESDGPGVGPASRVSAATPQNMGTVMLLLDAAAAR